MSPASANALLTCPDCGGILEPSRPEWATAIEYATASDPEEQGPSHWHCLICGFRNAAANQSAAVENGETRR